MPIYNKQPLFGDVCSFLNSKDIMFHKFLGLAGRSLIPVILNNSQLLKLAIFSYLYGSPDLSYFCLFNYDKRNHTKIIELFKKIN